MSSLEKILKFFSKLKGFDSNLKKVRITCADAGRCIAEFKVDEDHCNSMGKLHGGFTATLVDDISSLALRTLLDEKFHVSVDLSVSYMKGANIGDDVVIDANTLKAGKTLAFLEVILYDKKTNALIAKGSHTKYILETREEK